MSARDQVEQFAERFAAELEELHSLRAKLKAVERIAEDLDRQVAGRVREPQSYAHGYAVALEFAARKLRAALVTPLPG